MVVNIPYVHVYLHEEVYMQQFQKVKKYIFANLTMKVQHRVHLVRMGNNPQREGKRTQFLQVKTLNVRATQVTYYYQGYKKTCQCLAKCLDGIFEYAPFPLIPTTSISKDNLPLMGQGIPVYVNIYNHEQSVKSIQHLLVLNSVQTALEVDPWSIDLQDCHQFIPSQAS